MKWKRVGYSTALTQAKERPFSEVAVSITINLPLAPWGCPSHKRVGTIPQPGEIARDRDSAISSRRREKITRQAWRLWQDRPILWRFA
jgi:hypothetical protein